MNEYYLIKVIEEFKELLLIAFCVNQIAHTMVGTGDNKHPLFAFARLVVFKGHIDRYKGVVCTVYKKYRYITVFECFGAGKILGADAGASSEYFIGNSAVNTKGYL